MNNLEEHNNYINAKELNIMGTYKAYVFECTDGDTFDASIKYENIFIKIRIRLLNCDAFEMKIQKQYEGKKIINREEMKDLGKKAKNRLNELIKGKYVELKCQGFDVWSGRVLGEITKIEDKDINVAELLINEGHAFKYNGHGIKEQYKFFKF